MLLSVVGEGTGSSEDRGRGKPCIGIFTQLLSVPGIVCVNPR